MKDKGIEISFYGSVIGNSVNLPGIKPANDHIEWIVSVSSILSNNETIWAATVFEHRNGNNRMGKFVDKYNLYSGIGQLNKSSILSLKYDKEFKYTNKHHSNEPISPSILLSV